MTVYVVARPGHRQRRHVPDRAAADGLRHGRAAERLERGARVLRGGPDRLSRAGRRGPDHPAAARLTGRTGAVPTCTTSRSIMPRRTGPSVPIPRYAPLAHHLRCVPGIRPRPPSARGNRACPSTSSTSRCPSSTARRPMPGRRPRSPRRRASVRPGRAARSRRIQTDEEREFAATSRPAPTRPAGRRSAGRRGRRRMPAGDRDSAPRSFSLRGHHRRILGGS